MTKFRKKLIALGGIKELSKKSGIPHSSFYNYEKDPKKMSIHTAEKLEAEYGILWTDFIEECEQ